MSVVYIDLNNGFDVSQTSTDGGDTWGPIVSIGQDRGGSPPDQRVNCDLPTAAVDPINGTMYVFLTPGRYRFSAWATGYGSHAITGDVPPFDVQVPLPREGRLLLQSHAE